VVEDDPAVLAMAVETLEGLGYQVTTADTAAAALKRLKGRKAFDLLFSDVVMPGGVNGVELAHALKERPGLKVLLTSGYVGDEAASWANEFPMIDKPYLASTISAGRAAQVQRPVRLGGEAGRDSSRTRWASGWVAQWQPSGRGRSASWVFSIASA
jgi:CheY-like chemotaxis protein